MKIGVVTQSYYPVRGGVTEHVYHLARELMQRGHDVTIIAGGSDHAQDQGLRVLRIGHALPAHLNGATVSLVVGFGLGRRLRTIAEREQFDLVHIHAPLDPFLPLAATEHLSGPLVGTFHTYRETNPLATIFRQRYTRALRRLDARIAVSPSAAEFVTRYVEVPFQIIPNGVDTERFSPQAEPFPSFRDRVFTILYVGRMDPRKGARFLFAAMPYLERELPSYRLLIVGGGWRRRVYKQFIPLGLQRRVHFAGPASWDDLPRYYRSADLYCSPAIGGESFGIVLLEAMSSGLPLVASNIRGYRHVLTAGQEGLFAAPRDPRSIAQQIVTLARDPARAERMGQQGRATALRYDWRIITDQVESIYREAIGRHHRPIDASKH